MTTIATFSTFTNTENSQRLSMANLENIYMLTDSQLSILKDGNYIAQKGNHQKIFYEKRTSVVLGLAGVYDVGVKIIQKLLEKISNQKQIVECKDIDCKIEQIESVLYEVVKNFNQRNFKHNTTIVCNAVANGQFRTIKFLITKSKEEIIKTVFLPTERIEISFEGAGGAAFEKYKNIAFDIAPEHENRSKTYFKAFVTFLESKANDSSAPPCQGVVLNKEGKIKELSIMHSDHEFYKMGKLHIERQYLKNEIDYRDVNFKFLTKSKIL